MPAVEMEPTMIETILGTVLSWSIAVTELVDHTLTWLLRFFCSTVLLCAPYCTYTKAKPVIKEAKGLLHDYEQWRNNTRATVNLDLADSDDDSLNLHAVPIPLLRVRQNWGSHLKKHEKRTRRLFFGFLTIAVPIFCAMNVNANVCSTILGPILVSRCIMCAVHLAVFHISIGPQVRRLSFIMENLTHLYHPLSIVWIAMSSALAAILWAVVLFILAALELVLRSQNALHGFPLRPAAIVGLILLAMLPDVLYIVWICRSLHKHRLAA